MKKIIFLVLIIVTFCIIVSADLVYRNDGNVTEIVAGQVITPGATFSNVSYLYESQFTLISGYRTFYVDTGSATLAADITSTITITENAKYNFTFEASGTFEIYFNSILNDPLYVNSSTKTQNFMAAEVNKIIIKSKSTVGTYWYLLEKVR